MNSTTTKGAIPMSTAPGEAGTAQEAGEIAARLERILEDMSRTHDELLSLAGEHRSALARADERALESCRDRQGRAVTRLRDLEAQRQEAAVAVPGAPCSGRGSIQELTAGLPEGDRLRLASAAGRLRERVARLKRENDVTRMATESLLRHVKGVVAQIGQRLDGATYGPRPAGAETRTPLRTLDIRS